MGREYHGGSKTRLYKIWDCMRYRCNCPSCGHYDRYGGRGIRVCREWDESFSAFREWAMANGYRRNLTLDRENNDGDYEPDNCRWVTVRVQNKNRRPRHDLKFTREAILEVKRRFKAGERQCDISRALNLDRSDVSKVCRGLLYANVR